MKGGKKKRPRVQEDLGCCAEKFRVGPVAGGKAFIGCGSRSETSGCSWVLFFFLRFYLFIFRERGM